MSEMLMYRMMAECSVDIKGSATSICFGAKTGVWGVNKREKNEGGNNGGCKN